MTSDMKPQCVCMWLGVRCENNATAEDGFCNWCASFGTRTDEEQLSDPNAITHADGTFAGIGGQGQLHDFPLADKHGFNPTACWYEESGRARV